MKLIESTVHRRVNKRASSVSECSATAFPGVGGQPRRYGQSELAFTTPVTVHKTACHSAAACVAALALMETLTSSDRVFI